MRNAIKASFVAVAGAVVLSGLAAADPVYPLGSRIGLEPPAGMILNKTTNQFEDNDRKASVTLLDLPLQLYQEMERMVFAETNKPGVTIIKRESFPYASGIGYFVNVELTADGTKYRKWLLLGQSNVNPVPDLATLVSIQVPESAFGVYTDEVARKTLASVSFRPAPNEERLSLMPFKFDDLVGFEVAEVAPNGVILTDKPQRGGQPEVIVSVGKDAPMNADDRPIFARRLFEQNPMMGMEYISADNMRIGGMPGIEMKARAVTPDGKRITLVQWIRFQGSGYLRIVGGASSDEWDAVFPRLRALRDGVSMR